MVIFKDMSSGKEWQVAGSVVPPKGSAIHADDGRIWSVTAVEYRLVTIQSVSTLVAVLTVGDVSGGPRVRSLTDG